MIYELHKEKLRVLNFAVAKNNRKQGVGSAMVRRLIDKLSQQRREEIVLDVRESNLAAQLFFRSQGFFAIDIIPDFYEDTGDSAYRMSYLIRDKAEAW
jgi:ribosomal-protein-alanine N-acetyltransferase